jgi:hypothetical protein
MLSLLGIYRFFLDSSMNPCKAVKKLINEIQLNLGRGFRPFGSCACGMGRRQFFPLFGSFGSQSK